MHKYTLEEIANYGYAVLKPFEVPKSELGYLRCKHDIVNLSFGLHKISCPTKSKAIQFIQHRLHCLRRLKRAIYGPKEHSIYGHDDDNPEQPSRKKRKTISKSFSNSTTIYQHCIESIPTIETFYKCKRICHRQFLRQVSLMPKIISKIKNITVYDSHQHPHFKYIVTKIEPYDVNNSLPNSKNWIPPLPWRWHVTRLLEDPHLLKQDMEMGIPLNNIGLTRSECWAYQEQWAHQDQEAVINNIVMSLCSQPTAMYFYFKKYSDEYFQISYEILVTELNGDAIYSFGRGWGGYFHTFMDGVYSRYHEYQYTEAMFSSSCGGSSSGGSNQIPFRGLCRDVVGVILSFL